MRGCPKGAWPIPALFVLIITLCCFANAQNGMLMSDGAALSPGPTAGQGTSSCAGSPTTCPYANTINTAHGQH
jgi:hypothetical protein